MYGKLIKKQINATGGEGKYCVQLYSRRAALVSEIYLDAKEHDLPVLREGLWRRSMEPLIVRRSGH